MLEVIEEEKLLARADAMGTRIRERLSAFAKTPAGACIDALRGPGAMIAFDVVDADGKPDAAGAKAVATRALEAGLLLLTCGIHGNTVRILVPLTVSDAVLDEGLGLLEHALDR